MVTVSTIIPTRNRPDLLVGRAIASILAQTFTNWECIVVGDDTDSETVDAMEAICRRDHRFRFWNLPPVERLTGKAAWGIGGTRAWNAGLAKAEGEWRAYLADDDAFEPEHHAWLLAASDGVEFVYGASQVMTNGLADRDRIFGRQAPSPYDIVQGSYLAHWTVDLTAETEPATTSWDARLLERTLKNVRVRQIHGVVHRYYAASENRVHHGMPA